MVENISEKEKNKISLDPKEALSLLLSNSKAKFDETVEAHFKLNIDTKQSNQQVRGIALLPYGTGKKIRILAITQDENCAQALAAGADYAFGKEIVTKVTNENWFDYDVVVTTADMMPVIARISRYLGPKGLMPNLKAGTITNNLAQTIKEIKQGKIEYKADKNGIVHISLGKVSFGLEKVLANYETIYDVLVKNKPSAVKGIYFKSIFLSTTMGKGLKIKNKSF